MVAGEGAGDELPRRLEVDLDGTGVTEGEGRGGEVSEDRELTLSA